MNHDPEHISLVDTTVDTSMKIKERISYCITLINDTQEFLLANSRYLEPLVKEKYENIIMDTQLEIDELTKHKTYSNQR